MAYRIAPLIRLSAAKTWIAPAFVVFIFALGIQDKQSNASGLDAMDAELWLQALLHKHACTALLL